MEIGDWDFAFESIDARSREAIGGPFMLYLGTELESVPDTQISIRHAIVEAVRYRRGVESSPRGGRSIEIFYVPAEPTPEGDFLPEVAVTVFLARDEDRGGNGDENDAPWRLDLLRTGQYNFPQLFRPRVRRPRHRRRS
jgi:hypothetical protein